MSEAPERIIVTVSASGASWAPIPDRENHSLFFGETEYLRADLARLPDEMAGRLRTAVEFDLQEQFGGDLVKRLIEEVLAWREQQGGGK